MVVVVVVEEVEEEERPVGLLALWLCPVSALTVGRPQEERAGLCGVAGRDGRRPSEPMQIPPQSSVFVSRARGWQQQNLSRPMLSMGLQDMGFSFDDDELDTTSKLSSEDSGEMGSLMEDSDDSYSLELGDMEPAPGARMTLLEEIMDSLSSSKAMDQGRLSAAKSLDLLRSTEDVGYAGPNTSSAPSDPKAAGGGGGGVSVSGGDGGGGGTDAGAWHLGQDDSVLHGKHLPPSPRRHPPNKSSLRGLSRRPPVAPPTRPVTMMYPGVAVTVPGAAAAAPPPGSPAATPPTPRFNPSRVRPGGPPPPVPTKTPVSPQPPPTRNPGSRPDPEAPPRQGTGSRGAGPGEALVPWEREPGERGAAEARGPEGGVRGEEPGLLEAIDSTLKNSPQLPRLQLNRGTNNHAGAQSERSKF
ncbi:unnamed protein product [Arctogadus glacialis]